MKSRMNPWARYLRKICLRVRKADWFYFFACDQNLFVKIGRKVIEHEICDEKYVGDFEQNIHPDHIVLEKDRNPDRDHDRGE